MPIWAIVLIIVIVVILVIAITFSIALSFEKQEMAENEIEKALSKIGVENYTWKADANYDDCKSQIKAVITDLRDNRIKKAYLYRRPRIIKKIEQIVYKYYELDNNNYNN